MKILANDGTVIAPGISFNNDSDTGLYRTTSGQVGFASNGVLGPALDPGGIAFPATQVSSSNVNTLDDYEEGTWTPAVGGSATYTTQVGVYRKIGALVFVQCSLVINSIGSGSTSVVSGLPFASLGSGATSALAVSYFTSLAASISYFAMLVNTAVSTAAAEGIAVEGTGASAVGIFGNSAQVDFSGCYPVAT